MISYTNYQYAIKTSNGDYKVKKPCMEIQINLESSIKLIKDPAGIHYHSGYGEDKCDSCISIYVRTSMAKCEEISNAFKKIVRPFTCDNVFCYSCEPLNELRCSKLGAHLAIINFYEILGLKKDEWLSEAQLFISHGEEALKIRLFLADDFENKVRLTFKDQEGALNLLNDLKRLPFSYGIQLILERLIAGVYGVFTTEFDCHLEKLIADLKRQDLHSLVEPARSLRYDHEGPEYSQSKM